MRSMFRQAVMMFDLTSIRSQGEVDLLEIRGVRFEDVPGNPGEGGQGDSEYERLCQLSGVDTMVTSELLIRALES